MKQLNDGTFAVALVVNTSELTLILFPLLALPAGMPHYKANTLPAEVKAKWNGMSHDERIEYTKPLLKALKDEWEMKKLSLQNAPLNAFRDVCSNIASIQDEVRL